MSPRPASRWAAADQVVRRTVETITNTKLALRRLARTLTGYRGKIVLESTGNCHLLAATLLAEAGLDVRVVNPLLTKKYGQSSIRKVKSDPADAVMLAEMAARETELPAPFTFDAKRLTARQAIGMLQTIERQLQSLTRATAAADELSQTLGLPRMAGAAEMRTAIAKLKAARVKLQAVITQAEEAVTLTTIPGVSTFLALLIMTFFDARASARGWVAFAGLDVSVRQSGTWRGRGKLTKRGNGYLRKRLFSAAWGAMMHDTAFRAAYDKLRADGRSYTAALIILARRILRIAHAVLRTQQPYHAI